MLHPDSCTTTPVTASPATAPEQRDGRTRRRTLAGLAIAAAVLYLVLLLPNHPQAMTWGALGMFPLEWPVLLLFLWLAPAAAGWAQGVRWLIVFLLCLISLAKIADYATFLALGRAFNALVDWPLLHAVWRLSEDLLGGPLTLGLVGLGILAVFLMGVCLAWATRIWLQQPPPGNGIARHPLRILLLLATGLAIAEAGAALRVWTLPLDPPGAAFTARVGYERALLYRTTLRDLREFRVAAEQDPFAPEMSTLSWTLLGQRDVLVIFVESYGRTLLDNPRYAPTHRALLDEMEERLRTAGFAMRSAYLTAPTVGGQSWLAHASLAAGVWVDHQGRYQALLNSPRRTWYHYAQAAGWRTVAVMPAITQAWPEADYFGFTQVHAADSLGYAGKNFNWVTMPDQFTLHALDRLERSEPSGTARPPIMAQIALISSHAPWVPIPPLLDWDSLGDGTVFDPWADSDDPPEVVWRDRDRVRAQYQLAITYSMRVVMDYALRHARNPPVILLLGDHPPAPFVAETSDFDVPVHLLGPPEVLEAWPDWGWSPGLVPADTAPRWRMDALRDHFLAAMRTASPRGPPEP